MSKLSSDLESALTMAVGAYWDYRHYVRELSAIADNFDESLEVYDTHAWLHQYSASEKTDMVAQNCAASVGDAISAFEVITARAKEHFVKTLTTVLSAPPELQREVLGRPYYITNNDMDEEIEKLLELLDEAEYQYSIPSNYKSLLALMSDDEWAKGK